MYSWLNRRLDRRWPTEGLKTVFEMCFGFALHRCDLALGWPPSIKTLVNPRVHVSPRRK